MEYAAFEPEVNLHNSNSETILQNLPHGIPNIGHQTNPVLHGTGPRPGNGNSNSSHHTANQFPTFEFSNYPMTNPPLFDQSMFLNYNQDGTPVISKRRISISNGQIGQIINHEAVYNDSYFEDPFDIDREMSDSTGIQQQHPRPSSASQVSQQIPRQPQSVGPPGSGASAGRQLNERIQPPMVMGTLDQVQMTDPNGGVSDIPPPGRGVPSQVTGTYPIQAEGNPFPVDGIDKKTLDHSTFAGVPPPNHQLIYNNEIIYNPDNGPVPGTAAWKKDRLLERNRVAASKCRQRKKQAQQQLIDDLNDLKTSKKEMEEKLKNYEKLFNLFQSFYEKTSNFERIDNFRNFNILSTALKTKNQDDLFKILDSFDDNDKDM